MANLEDVGILDAHTGFFRGTIEVPAGIQSAIEVSAHDVGIAAMALWAQGLTERSIRYVTLTGATTATRAGPRLKVRSTASEEST